MISDMTLENNKTVNGVPAEAQFEIVSPQTTKPFCNCYLLMAAKDFRLTKETARKDIVGRADLISDGWVYEKKEDAEAVANRNSNGKRKMRAVQWRHDCIDDLWHGNKSASKLARRKISLEIDRDKQNREKKKFQDECHVKGLHPAWLNSKTLQEDMSEEEKRLYQYYKPLWDELNEKQSDIELKEHDLNIAEEDSKEAEIQSGVNRNNWPFKVLGYNNKREIFLWHQGDLMLIPVKQLSAKDLQLLMGPSFEEGAEKAIIEEAHSKGKKYDDKPLKAGIWKFKNKWLVVSGKRAVTISGGKLSTLDSPVFEDRIIRFESKDWIDWKHFKSVFGKITLDCIYRKIQTRVAAWNWAHSSMAEYTTAFVLLSPFQQAMTWRPWLHLTGARGTGKSSFFEYILLALFVFLSQKLDKSTAHAAAQTIGNTCKIPIFDEFEKNKHIPDILEMFKLSNAGGVKTSGTPGEKSFEFELHHMPWFGSIYLPKQISQDSAQESRIIKLELKKLADSVPLLEKIDSDESAKLAAEIVAAMVFHWGEIEQQAKSVCKNRKDIMTQKQGIQIRTIDNFMYASAVLNLVSGRNHDVPEWASTTNEDDGEKIISVILSSMIRIGSDSYSISDCIEKSIGDQVGGFVKELENVGLKVTTNNGSRYLALRSGNVVRFLLKDTDYKDMDIQAPLSRIEGAISTHPVKFSGKPERCVLVPMVFITGKSPNRTSVTSVTNV